MATLILPLAGAIAGGAAFWGTAFASTAIGIGWGVDSSIGRLFVPTLTQPPPGEPNKANDEHSERLDPG